MSDSVRPHRWQPTRLPRPWDSPGKNTGVGCHFLLQCMKVKSESEVAQSCPTLSDPMDCSPPGSSIHGIFQARVLEWGAITGPLKEILQMHKSCKKRKWISTIPFLVWVIVHIPVNFLPNSIFTELRFWFLSFSNVVLTILCIYVYILLCKCWS